MKKRIMSIVLVAVMMLVLLPTFSANAASSDAIEIYTAEDLDAVRYDLTADYILMNDIDLSQSEFSESWLPLGCDGVYRLTEEFSGTFDGNGYSISGMNVIVPNNYYDCYSGLFARVTGKICNLNMENASISSQSYSNSNNRYIGGIAGSNSGDIYNCCFSGSVSASNSFSGSNSILDPSYIGSIVGANSGNIYNCSVYGKLNSTASTSIFADALFSLSAVAGLNSGNISCCVNFASVNSAGGSAGIVNLNSSGIISNCYNVGDIKENTKYYGVAGIVYDNQGTVENCYNVGKIVGGSTDYAGPIVYYNGGTITNCYYLTGTAPTTSFTGIMVLSASGMKNQKAYKGFDFENVWEIDSTAEYKYPTLRNVTYLPYYNSDSSEYYKELSSAINNAKSGETIKVMDDAEIYNVSLDEGVTLDLNGHIITANRFVGYNGSAIIDSSSAKTGRIYAEKSKVIVAKNNPQLPVYDNANKCFAFAEIKTKSSDNSDRFRLDKGDDKYTYSISPVFGESADARTLVHDLIATYGEDSGVSVEILISWKNDTLTENRSYIYNVETVKSIVRSFSDNNYSRKFIASFKWANIADANNASICAVIRSSTGAEIRSAVIDIVA